MCGSRYVSEQDHTQWFIEYRLAWIKESVEIFGQVNRDNLIRKFGISMPLASLDIRKALERWPDLMTYNKSTKRYERNGD
jgi:phenylalanyl-tRNA synthetase beta subunit